MWVEEKARGQGIGSALLKHIISAYTADHLMRLDCLRHAKTSTSATAFTHSLRLEGVPASIWPVLERVSQTFCIGCP